MRRVGALGPRPGGGGRAAGAALPGGDPFTRQRATSVAEAKAIAREHQRRS